MGTAVLIAIIVSTAIACIGTEVMLIRSFFGELKSRFTHALIMDVATKALEDKTGVNVKSLIDNKPHPSDPSGTVANEGNLLQKGANTITGFGLKTLGTFGSLGEAGLKKGFNFIDEKNDKNISRAAKFYATLGKEKVKHYIKQTGDDITETAGLYGDAFKQMIPERVKKTVKGAKTKINDGKRWINKQKNNISDIRKNISNAMDDTHFAKLSEAGDILLDNSLIRTRRRGRSSIIPPHIDELHVRFRDPNGQINQNVARRREIQNFTNPLQQLDNSNNSNINNVNLSDAKRKDYINEMNRYKQIVGGLKNKKNYTEYANNAKEFAIASMEINKHFAEDKKGAELANKMLEDIVKRNPENLNRDTLVRKTLDFYAGYDSNTVRETLRRKRNDSEKENQITGEEIGAEFGKLVGNSKGEPEIAKRLNDAAKAYGNPKEFREKIFNDIAAEMRGESNGNKALTYLGKENADRIKEKLENKHIANVEAAVDKARIEISKNYRTEGQSDLDALRQVERLESGAFDREAYKKALEETIKSINTDNTRNSNETISDTRVIENVQNVQNVQNIQSVEANTTGNTIIQEESRVAPSEPQVVQIQSEPQVIQVAQPEPQVVQVAQPEQQIVQVAQSEAQVVQVAQPEQQVVQVAPSEPQVIQVAQPEPQVIQVAQPEQQVVQATQSEPQVAQGAQPGPQVVQGQSERSTTIEMPNTTGVNQEPISPDTLQRISYESAMRATQPFQDTVKDIKKLFDIIGGDNPEAAGRRINEAITNMTSGQNTVVTESMIELFNKIGGNPKSGAEILGKTLNRLNIDISTNPSSINYDELIDSIAGEIIIANQGTSQTPKKSTKISSTKRGKTPRKPKSESKKSRTEKVNPFITIDGTDGTHNDAT